MEHALGQIVSMDPLHIINSKINTDISHKDTMYTGNDESYFLTGYSALQCVWKAMYAADKKEAHNILDFACGHGRVLRMLRASFPDAKIIACDIDRDSVDFCSKTFNVAPVYSKEQLKDVEIKENFDIIWVGSLFTHLDRSKWDNYLRFLIDHLSPGGLLAFTTHGRTPAEWMRRGATPYELTPKQIYQLDDHQFKRIVKNFDSDGFGYENYPFLPDYGISLTSPSWVMAKLEKFTQIQLVMYLEHGWGCHQDVVACKKEL